MPSTAGDYWAVPEGTIGNIVNLFSAGGSYAQWHVVQDSKRPNSSALGPYDTYNAAEAVAQNFNKNPASPAQNVADAIGLGGTTGLANKLQSPDLWVRVAEFLVGGMILYLGVKGLSAPAGQVLAAPVKGAARKVNNQALKSGTKKTVKKTVKRAAETAAVS
jgi:hypothetical protein